MENSTMDKSKCYRLTAFQEIGYNTHLQPVKARSIALTVAFPEQMCQVASTGKWPKFSSALEGMSV
jgi:hypothetical protein